MKKLLLLSLLALSATSFADIFQGESDHVTVPIKVTGEVVDTNNTNLIIETDKTTGVDGGAILFDFGKIAKTTTETTISRSANFKVRKGNNAVFNTSSEDVTVGVLKGNAVVASNETSGTPVAVLGNGKIVYTVTSDATAANAKPTEGAKVINGTLKVDVVVGTDSKAGQLLDSSQRLVAYLAAQG